jgi:hypothetical protein
MSLNLLGGAEGKLERNVEVSVRIAEGAAEM